MTEILGLVREQQIYRVLSKDRVYYVVMSGDEYINTFTDERCMYPAGVWHWQEQEIIKAVRENYKENAMSH